MCDENTDEYICISYETLIVGNLSVCAKILTNQALGTFRFLNALILIHDCLVYLLTRILSRDPDKLHLHDNVRKKAAKNASNYSRDYSEALVELSQDGNINNLENLFLNFCQIYQIKFLDSDNIKKLNDARNTLVHYTNLSSIPKSYVLELIRSALNVTCEIFEMNHQFRESDLVTIKEKIAQIKSHIQ